MGFAGAPRAGLGAEGASSLQRNHCWRDNMPGRENLPAQTLSKVASVLNYSVIYVQDDFWVESLLRRPGLQFSEVLLVGIVSARHFFLPEECILPRWGPKQGAELLGKQNKQTNKNRDSLSYVACPDFIPCSAPSPGCGWADAGILCHCDSGHRWSGTVPWGCPALTLPFPARSRLRLLVGTMAGQRQLVLPLQGLLLCILALHFGTWGPLATAEHKAAPNASSVVSNASLVAPNASSVISNASSVAPNASSVAPNSFLVAPNASFVAPKTSSVAPNASMNSTEGTRLTCQSFQCSGERCYQDAAHANETAACHNETFCELYRFSSTNYTARCSSACGTEPCRTNSSVSMQQCALECCNTPLCLQLNASSYGDLPATTVPPTTTVATTTPRPPPRNGKVCAAFTCHGDGCFKGKKTTARCIVGYDFCQMKKTGLDFVAGCSKACKAAKPVCAKGVKAACYQECCPATPKGSCLKLDGKIHLNAAGQLPLAPLLQLLACGAALLLNHGVSAPLRL